MDAETNFFGIAHHDLFLANTTPMYDPSQQGVDKEPLTDIDQIQLALHSNSTSNGIIRWKAMNPSKLKWRSLLAKMILDIELEEDTL